MIFFNEFGQRRFQCVTVNLPPGPDSASQRTSEHPLEIGETDTVRLFHEGLPDLVIKGKTELFFKFPEKETASLGGRGRRIVSGSKKILTSGAAV